MSKKKRKSLHPKLLGQIETLVGTWRNQVTAASRPHFTEHGREKTAYASELLARNAHYLQCIKRGNENHGALPYLCPLCHQWHNGRPPTRTPKEKHYDPLVEIELGIRVAMRLDPYSASLPKTPWNPNRAKPKRIRPTRVSRETITYSEDT